MKKTLLLLVLLLTAATGVHAQDDIRALGAAVDTILRVYTQDDITDKIINDVFEKSNRNAELGTRIAKAYYHYNETEENRYNAQATHKLRNFHKNDTIRALKYICAALQTDSSYAEAYVVAADMFDYDGRSDIAMDWLDRGLKNNPSDSSLYIAEAKILARKDIELAKKKLEVLRQRDPSIPIDIYIARIYNDIDIKGNEYRKEIAYHYSLVDISKMSQGDVETMIMSLYWSGSLDECCSKATVALKKFPESYSINQFYFRSLLQLKKYNESLMAYDRYKLVNHPKLQHPVIGVRDSIYYAAALAGLKKFDEAMALYDLILTNPNIPSKERESAEYYVGECMQLMINDYKDKGEYQRAADVYQAFVKKLISTGKMTDDKWDVYANIYVEWSAKLSSPQKEETLMKLDQVYVAAIEHSKVNNALFAYKRYKYVYVQMDKKAETGVAVPAIQQLEAIIKSKEKMDSRDKIFLSEVYPYMLYYYSNSKNYSGAIEYAEKTLDIDPTNQGALTVISSYSKFVKKKKK